MPATLGLVHRTDSPGVPGSSPREPRGVSLLNAVRAGAPLPEQATVRVQMLRQYEDELPSKKLRGIPKAERHDFH